MKNQRIINHIAFVLDASFSMQPHAKDLIKVADAEIATLAQRSKDLNQETRVTIYGFGDDVECLVFDTDVLRLPSIAELYRIDGNTSLIAATMKSQDDLARTAQMYDDHAFLTYILTDGEENVSIYSKVFGGSGRRVRYIGQQSSEYSVADLVEKLRVRLDSLPNNWTVAVMVPDQRGVFNAKSYGFPADNIAVWDTSEGVGEAFTTLRTATENFMTARATGVRGSRTIFAGGNVTKEAVKDAGLKHLPRANYHLIPVKEKVQIRPFVEAKTKKPYVTGSAFYELMKPEKVQAAKKVCVRNRKTGRLYSGEAARKLLNLPDHEVRVKPEDNKDYQIFVQSTSVNRNLVADTKLLVMKS